MNSVYLASIQVIGFGERKTTGKLKKLATLARRMLSTAGKPASTGECPACEPLRRVLSPTLSALICGDGISVRFTTSPLTVTSSAKGRKQGSAGVSLL